VTASELPSYLKKFEENSYSYIQLLTNFLVQQRIDIIDDKLLLSDRL